MAPSTVISVRGEARRTVAPDFMTMHCSLSATAGSRADALAQLHAAQQVLVGALTGLGGSVLTVDSRRDALTWSVGSIGTHEDHDFDERTRRHGPSGRVIAEAHVVVTARDLTLLDRLAAAVAPLERLNVDGVSWYVDPDNEQWRGVRADAIAAALAKGRDYAAALGGTVTSVEQVADAGLLANDDGRSAREMSLFHGQTISGSGSDSPSLDPVPQDIHAVVEARLVAEVDPLH